MIHKSPHADKCPVLGGKVNWRRGRKKRQAKFAVLIFY